MASFEARKAKIIGQLDLPVELYHDASPKGSVDENIQDLVAEINGLDDMVTTSSCGGRVAVYAEGTSKTSSGGKGGGHWLFTSHRPIEAAVLTDTIALPAYFGLPVMQHDIASLDTQVEQRNNQHFVHFKFEPLILHVLTKSHQTAQKLLSAAMDAGYRESGISGIVSNNARKPVTPMVAIRSTGLGFDCIVASYSDLEEGTGSKSQIRTMVSADYLATLGRIANKRFEMNEQRKERFRIALRARMANLSSNPR